MTWPRHNIQESGKKSTENNKQKFENKFCIIWDSKNYH